MTMDDFQIFDNFLEQLCAAGAGAVKRYVEVSRTDPVSDCMPESFLESIVFDRLGLRKDGSGSD
jgi:hypothetical protein